MFYLRPKKIDVSTGSRKYILINSKTAIDEGISNDSKLEISNPLTGTSTVVEVDLTEKLVSAEEVGIDIETYNILELSNTELLSLDFLSPPKSLSHIRSKLLGNRLGYSEFKEILEDIISKRLGQIETTYFASTGFNPGYNDEEIFDLTKAMANSGSMISWPYEKVVDKHSIGGLAGKGITPIIVSIISSLGLVIPNTSTRAITAPAGTTDVLEVLCDVDFNINEIEKLVKKNGACFVWGGGLDLAPADDALIEIEKPLGIELYDKFIVSILAKKVASGLTHLVLDLPHGPDTKVPNNKDVEVIKKKFEEISRKFGLKIKVHTREANGPDGRGIGPVLEAIDTLKVLRQEPDRFLHLEEISLQLAGELLELSEEAKQGEGYKIAKKQLSSGKAYRKFQKLIEAQGGNPNVKVEDIQVGTFKYEYKATTNGIVNRISNRTLKDLAHSLGNPTVKSSGIFLNKHLNESYVKGDTIFTLFSVSESRLNLAKKILDFSKLFD